MILFNGIKKREIVLSAILLLLNQQMWAQDCLEKLSEARTAYNKGQFSNCIDLIATCAESDDENISFRAHRMMAMAHLGNNEPELARAQAIEMLNLNPRYKSNAINDPSDLVSLLKGISVVPKFSIGLALSLGTNTTYPDISNVFMVTSQTKKYSGNSTLQFGISTSYQLNKNFSVFTMLRANAKSYQLDYEFDNWKMKVNEDLNYLHLPLMINYSPLAKMRLRPFVQGGAFAGYLLYSTNSFTANNSENELSYSLSNISSVERRNAIDYGWVAGAGLQYQLGEGNLIVMCNYFMSMSNITVSENRYNYPELLYPFYYLDDDMYLHNLSFSVGYSIYLNYKVLNK